LLQVGRFVMGNVAFVSAEFPGICPRCATRRGPAGFAVVIDPPLLREET
jgi:hypothetical protein